MIGVGNLDPRFSGALLLTTDEQCENRLVSYSDIHTLGRRWSSFIRYVGKYGSASQAREGWEEIGVETGDSTSRAPRPFIELEFHVFFPYSHATTDPRARRYLLHSILLPCQHRRRS